MTRTVRSDPDGHVAQERLRAALQGMNPEATVKAALGTLIGQGQKLRHVLDLDAPGRPYDQDLLLWDVGQVAVALVQLCTATGVDFSQALSVGVVDCERRLAERRTRIREAAAR